MPERPIFAASLGAGISRSEICGFIVIEPGTYNFAVVTGNQCDAGVLAAVQFMATPVSGTQQRSVTYRAVAGSVGATFEGAVRPAPRR